MIVTRIGDYELTRSLPAIAADVLELEAMHVLLPRVAHIRIAAHDAAKQLMRQACILEALRYPGVPRIYECGLLDDRRPWIAYEALEGPTLAEMMLERAWAPTEMLVVMRDLAEILHHAHTRGVAHARLRADSIARHEGALYITGWGVAEVAANPRDDIRALGSIMSLTMSGTIPRPIHALLERMTSVEHAQPSAAEVRAEAIRLLENVDDEVELVLVELDEEMLASRDG
jgi:serine/threonine protein kinase